MDEKQKLEIQQEIKEMLASVRPKIEAEYNRGDRDIHHLDIVRGSQQIELPFQYPVALHSTLNIEH